MAYVDPNMAGPLSEEERKRLLMSQASGGPPPVADPNDPTPDAKFKAWVMGGATPAAVPAAPAAARPVPTAPAAPALTMPSNEPQHFGKSMDEIRARGGAYGTTPSGNTYGYDIGGDPMVARMNALGKGGVGDQAEAMRLLNMQMHGPGPGMTDPRNQAAAMQAYLGLAKQSVDTGRAGVEEYLGIGKLGNDRTGLELQRGQLGIQDRAQTLAETKDAREADKNQLEQKFYDGLVLSGRTPAEADAVIKQRRLSVGSGSSPGLGAGEQPFDPHRPNAAFEQAVGPELLKEVDAAKAAGQHQSTVLANLHSKMGDAAFMQALPAIQQLINSRYGANGFKDAVTPGAARTQMRRVFSMLGGPSAEATITSKLRNFLGMGVPSSGPILDYVDYRTGGYQRPQGPTVETMFPGEENAAKRAALYAGVR